MDEAAEPCLTCFRRPPAQSGTVVWGEHDGVLRGAILAMKHRGRDDLADPLALRLAAGVAATEWADEITIVSWVPSHVIRRIRRPFPAARMLAAGVAQRIGAPCRRLLVRRGLHRQTGHSRSRRMRLSRRAFKGRPSAHGEVVLLVDDVITTGTTVRRATEAILAAGAARVFCAALAMTPASRSSS